MTPRRAHAVRVIRCAAALGALALGTLAAGGLTPSAAGAQSLRGSRASVARMHRQARAERLHFYETSAGVRRAARRGRLVRIASGRDVALHKVGYPYVRPATRTFVRRLGAQYRAACGERLVVTSATRPATRQPANSSTRSVHPAGIAVDLRKPSGRCLTWLRKTLLQLEGGGLIEVTEEFGPPHFHVAVYPTPYARYVSARTRRDGTALAARSRARARADEADADR